MREVARQDYARAVIACTWPLVDVLCIYRSLAQRNALATYRHDLLFWALMAPHAKSKLRPPIKPHILDD